MITQVSNITIFVQDQQRAKAFYTEKLGMEVRSEAPLYPGSPVVWLAVAPKGAATELILYQMDESWAHYKPVMGEMQNLILGVDNLDQTYADLKAKGVAFTQEPVNESWGKWTMLIDSEGNQLLLVESA